jgi:hypothetical protein
MNELFPESHACGILSARVLHGDVEHSVEPRSMTHVRKQSAGIVAVVSWLEAQRLAVEHVTHS